MTAVQVNVKPPKATSGFGIAALVLGIFACLTCWIPFIGVVGMPLAVLGLLFGGIGILTSLIGRRSGVGMPMAGSVVCVVSLIVAISMTGAAVDRYKAIVKETDKKLADANQQVVPVASPTQTAPQGIKWASLGEAIRQGDIEFQLTGVELGKPKIAGYAGEDVQADAPVLVVRFRFTNRSENKRILYTMDEKESKVTDNFGNVYGGDNSSFRRIAGVETYANVYPGKSVDGGVRFDPPVAGFSALMIELPARDEWGGGVFHFKVPAANVVKIN